MNTQRIAKKSGGYRTVVTPSPAEKERLRAMLPALNILQLALCNTEVVHGCIPGGNPVSGARKHIGYDFTLCADLSDFFGNVFKSDIESRFKKFKEFLPDTNAYVTTTDTNRPPSSMMIAAQGLPTSPALANLRAADLDRSLVFWCKERGIVYTRYVDDLAFSSNNKPDLLELRAALPSTIERHGLKQNEKKTRLLWAGPNRSWRRVIYGVAVGEKDCQPTRRARRRLRAARHKGRRPGYHRNSARGLAEWMKLKPPKRALVTAPLRTDFTMIQHVTAEEAKAIVFLPVIQRALAQDRKAK